MRDEKEERKKEQAKQTNKQSMYTTSIYIVYTGDSTILILSSYLSERYCVNGTYIRVHTYVLLVCTLYIHTCSYLHSIIGNNIVQDLYC